METLEEIETEDRCRAQRNNRHLSRSPGLLTGVMLWSFAPRKENFAWSVLLKAIQQGGFRDRILIPITMLGTVVCTWVQYSLSSQVDTIAIVAVLYFSLLIVISSTPANLAKYVLRRERATDILSAPVQSKEYVQASLRFFLGIAVLFGAVGLGLTAGYYKLHYGNLRNISPSDLKDLSYFYGCLILVLWTALGCRLAGRGFKVGLLAYAALWVWLLTRVDTQSPGIQPKTFSNLSLISCAVLGNWAWGYAWRNLLSYLRRRAFP